MSELFENNTTSSFEFCVGRWSTIQKGTICTIVASRRLLKLCRHQLNENRRIGTHSNLVSELSSNRINSKHVKNVVSCSSFPFHCFRSDRNETCLELKCHVRESFSYARPGVFPYTVNCHRKHTAWLKVTYLWFISWSRTRLETSTPAFPLHKETISKLIPFKILQSHIQLWLYYDNMQTICICDCHSFYNTKNGLQGPPGKVNRPSHSMWLNGKQCIGLIHFEVVWERWGRKWGLTLQKKAQNNMGKPVG